MSQPGAGELELELTYLAREIPTEVDNTEPTRLEDIYIPADLDVHSKLRLRQKGGNYEITKKVPLSEDDASSQMEHTIPLAENEFSILAAVSEKRVIKDRYNLTLAGVPAEVDVFRGLLEGLVVIDFEFSDEATKKSFVPPSECLADVTQEDFIAGGNLAGKSYADIESELNRFDYKKL